MGLAEYNRKRNFKLTREPPGDEAREARGVAGRRAPSAPGRS